MTSTRAGAPQKLLAAWAAPEDPGVWHATSLRDDLTTAGARRFQLNVDDADVPASALRLERSATPVRVMTAVWLDPEAENASADTVLAVLRRAAGSEPVGAWRVTEYLPLPPPGAPDGQRQPTLANLALLRRPEEMSHETWRSRWLDDHTHVAIETQATFGYVQNLVTDPLVPSDPDVAGIVEELFPPEAAGDLHAFYGSGGDDTELDRRLTRLMTSVHRFGADQDLDLVATSRYCWDLAAT